MTTLLENRPSAIGDARQPVGTDAVHTVDEVLASVAELAPLVARRGAEIARERGLPADLGGALRSARRYGLLGED